MPKQLLLHLARWLFRPTIRVEHHLTSLREPDPELERTLARRVRARLRQARQFG